MMLADLLTTLVTRNVFRATRAKDLQTSLRYLAAALGYPSPSACPVDATSLAVETWLQALEAHFDALTAQGRTISPATRRNTRHNLRVVFRGAEAQGLLTAPLPVPLLARSSRRDFDRHQRATAPYQANYHPPTGLRGWGLPRAQWPPEVQAGWQAYQTHRGLRLRETTVRSYAQRLETYLGYILHVVGRPPTWEDCFDPTQLAAFVRWHGQRLGRPISVQGRSVVVVMVAMAKAMAHPHAQALATLRGTLPPPTPLHIKRTHWVSLAQLEAVAEALLHEGRAPLASHQIAQHPRAHRATRFAKGLMLKLLVRVPLRQRNVREMRIDEHLYQDQAPPCHWHLHFQGSDLKVATRGGQINKYHIDLTDYCPDLLPALEEWLTEHRLRLPGAATSPFLFLTQKGRPFTAPFLRDELASAVAMRTGKRFYPHLIRTIWATECLKQTRDYTLAATMLGDTEQMVIKTYHDVLDEDQHTKAKAFLSAALHAG